MSTSASPRRWLVRGAGVLAIALFLGLVARYYHPVYRFTALIQLDGANDDFKLARFHELPVYVHRDTGGYDGLYYAQIAYHPLLDSAELHRAIDNFSYRARRMLPATLSWLVAGGNPSWIVHVYSVLNVFAWLALAGLLWRLLAVNDARGWIAWAGVMFSAGAMASVRLALTDLPALLLIAGALVRAEKGRARRATGLLAAAALARETSLVALTALWERPWISWRNGWRTLAAALPLAGWLLYVLWRVGPANQGWANLTLPMIGWVEKALETYYAMFTVADRPLAWTTLLAMIGLTAQAAFLIVYRQWENRWWRLGAGYTVLMACLGTAVWEGFPGAAMRVLLPLTLAFNVLGQRCRAPLAWLLAGNLTVFAGIVAFRDAPKDEREFAAGRSHGVGWLAQADEGWDGREQHGRRVWQWTRQGGDVRIETWPKTTAAGEVHFRIRALAPCDVTVRQGGRELAQLRAGLALTDHVVRVALDGGHAKLEFSTDAAPTRESAEPGARELAFALYDLRLALSDP